MADNQTTDIVDRLREWSAADLDTHAVLRRRGRVVAEVPWVRHATDLSADMAQAAAEIERLRARLDDLEMHGLRDIAPGWVCVCTTEWEQVYDKQD